MYNIKIDKYAEALIEKYGKHRKDSIQSSNISYFSTVKNSSPTDYSSYIIKLQNYLDLRQYEDAEKLKKMLNVQLHISISQ